MNPSNDDLKTLFSEQSNSVMPGEDFDARLNERLSVRRQRRTIALVSCICLCLAFGVSQWTDTTEPSVAEQTNWVASLDALWLEYDEEKDALLDEEVWGDEHVEFPSDYAVLAQIFDDTNKMEVIQ